MVEIADTAAVSRASIKDARAQAPATSSDAGAFVPLTAVTLSQWRALAERAVEPNGYYLPDWESAVNAFASGRTGVFALSAPGDTRKTARRG